VPYQQGLPNRAGYWPGLQLIRHFRRTYTLAQIATWTPAQADAKVMVTLGELGQRTPDRQQFRSAVGAWTAIKPEATFGAQRGFYNGKSPAAW
jgi:hypothetical protein